MDDGGGIREIISRKLIKPSNQTVGDRRIYRLSWFDRNASPTYIPFVLFYRRNPAPPTSSTCSATSTTAVTNEDVLSWRLKNSLSTALNLYYPFAGRIHANEEWVVCKDQGVIFFEAKLRRKLSAILKNPPDQTETMLELLFPLNLQWKDTNLQRRGAVLAIQVNHLECGGLAIGVCLSHKVGDAATLTAFLNYWAAVASGNDQRPQEMSLDLLYKASSLFLVGDQNPLVPELPAPDRDHHQVANCVTRRFVFDASKIAVLKLLEAHQNVQEPSDVEVVTALLYKCAICAEADSKQILAYCSSADHHDDDQFRRPCRPSLLLQNVNMRGRIVPNLGNESMGNFVWASTVVTEAEIIQMGDLLVQMQKEMAHLRNTFANNLIGNAGWLDLIRERMEEMVKAFQKANPRVPLVYRFINWCNLPLYQVDFGFGKPIWVSVPGCLEKNWIILMDANDGTGIEALVCLEKQVMEVFKRDEFLLDFAASNPSVDID